MRKSWIVCLVAVSMFTAVALRANAQDEKKDDVFMDEGDGDFDSMPAVPQVLPKGKATKTNAPVAAEPPAPTAAPAAAPEAPPEQAAAPAPVDVPEAAPVKEAPSEEAQAAEPKDNSNGLIQVEHTHASKNPPPKIDSPAAAEQPAEQAAAPAPGADEAAAAPEAPAPAPAPAKQAKHKALKGVAPHGTFAVTNGPCPMTREPASESEKMITVRAARKIWVEKVDGDWVRAFNKAGEPGYIQSSCVQMGN